MKNIKDIKYTFFVTIMAVIMFTACGISSSDLSEPASVNPEEISKDSEQTEKASAESEIPKGEENTESVSEDQTADADKDTDNVKVRYPDSRYAEEVDEKLGISSAGNYIKTRETDNKSGDVIDTSIYKDKNAIVKIVTEDYGSEGRIVSESYYSGDKTAYIRQYKTDIYGINSSYDEADLGDIDGEYSKEVMEKAETALKDARANKGLTLLYGYAGDEQGGVLKNVTVNIRNVEGNYNSEAVTDGDGYYSFSVPQKDDTYNLTFTYDTWAVSSLNDVHIVPGTPEYSLGRVYVAPAGNSIHETDVYLLNVNSRSPVSLKKGEYAAVLTSDDPAMSMRLVDMDKQDSRTGKEIKFDPSKGKNGFALFVEDDDHLLRDDMAGNIGRTYMTVTIYDKDGIVAAYREPSGRLGTLWKVCTIDNSGDIAISGIMYTDSKGWNW